MKTEKRLRVPDSTTITVSLKIQLRDRIDAAAKAVQATQPIAQEQKTAPTPSQASTEATRAAEVAAEERRKRLAKLKKAQSQGRSM